MARAITASPVVPRRQAILMILQHSCTNTCFSVEHRLELDPNQAPLVQYSAYHANPQRFKQQKITGPPVDLLEQITDDEIDLFKPAHGTTLLDKKAVFDESMYQENCLPVEKYVASVRRHGTNRPPPSAKGETETGASSGAQDLQSAQTADNEADYRDAVAGYNLAELTDEKGYTKNVVSENQDSVKDKTSAWEESKRELRKAYERAYGTESAMPERMQQLCENWKSTRFEPGSVRAVWSLIHPSGCKTRGALRLTCQYTHDDDTWHEVQYVDGLPLSATRMDVDDTSFNGKLELDLSHVHSDGSYRSPSHDLLGNGRELRDALQDGMERLAEEQDKEATDVGRQKGKYESMAITNRVRDAILTSAHELGPQVTECCSRVNQAVVNRCFALRQYAEATADEWVDEEKAQRYLRYLSSVEEIVRATAEETELEAAAFALKLQQLVPPVAHHHGFFDDKASNNEASDNEASDYEVSDDEDELPQEAEHLPELRSKLEAEQSCRPYATRVSQARQSREDFSKAFSEKYDREVPRSLLEWQEFLGEKRPAVDAPTLIIPDSEADRSWSQLSLAPDQDDGGKSPASDTSSVRSRSNCMPESMRKQYSRLPGPEVGSLTFSDTLLSPPSSLK
ncbi:hypothetical protein IAT40_002949 [Kwoniella sp. CBS 6097]